MAKISRKQNLYVIRSPLRKEEFDEDIGDWCKYNKVNIQHANPSGCALSIEDCVATDARLAFLFKTICEFEAVRL